jgi:hypothetical protein
MKTIRLPIAVATLLCVGACAEIPAAISAAQTLTDALNSPIGKSLLAWTASAPEVSAIVAKVDSGVVAAQSGIGLACGTLSIAHNANSFFASSLGETPAEIAKVNGEFALAEPICANPPQDARSALASVASLAQTIWARLKGGGVPVPAA